MHTDADRWREPVTPAVLIEGPLDGDGAVDGEGWLIEGDEEAVTRPLHDVPLMLGNDRGHCAVVPSANALPRLVPNGAQQRRRIHDVGEHERTHRRRWGVVAEPSSRFARVGRCAQDLECPVLRSARARPTLRRHLDEDWRDASELGRSHTPGPDLLPATDAEPEVVGCLGEIAALPLVTRRRMHWPPRLCSIPRRRPPPQRAQPPRNLVVTGGNGDLDLCRARVAPKRRFVGRPFDGARDHLVAPSRSPVRRRRSAIPVAGPPSRTPR